MIFSKVLKIEMMKNESEHSKQIYECKNKKWKV